MHQLAEGEECEFHPRRRIEFMSTNLKEERLLKCQTCLIRGKLSATTLIPIQDILESEDNTIFANWPFENDELLVRLESVPKPDKLSNDFDLKIDEYFKEIKIKIDKSLDDAYKNMQIKADQASGNSKRVLELYNKLSAKDGLKSALSENSKQANREKQLRLVLQKAQENINLQPLLEELKKFENDKIAINYEETNKIIKEVENLISKIDLFGFPEKHSKDNSSIKEQELNRLNPQNSHTKSTNSSSSILSQSFEGSSFHKLSTSELILELASNPFNRCSPQLLEELKTVLRSEASQKLDEQIISGLDNKIFAQIQSWESLKTDQIKQVTEFANQIAKFNNEVLNDRQIKGKRETNTVQIIKLIQNPFNNCSDQFIEFIHDNLNKISEFFTSLEFPQIQFTDFQVLMQEKQSSRLLLQDLKKLTYSMNSLRSLTSVGDSEVRKNQLIRALDCCKESFDFQFLENFKSMLKDYSNIFANILFTRPFQDVERGQPLNYINLSPIQRTNIQELINTLTQGTTQLNNSFVQREFPNCKTVSQILKLQDKQNNNYITDLLSKYPIFDLQGAKTITQPQSIPLFTELRQSNSMIGSIRSTFIQDSCVFNTNKGNNKASPSQFYIPLDSEANYIFTFRASSFLNPSNQRGQLSLGLVKLENVQTIDPTREGYCFVSSLQRSNVNLINSNRPFLDLTKTLLNFELRLSLARNLLLFADSPQYENKYNIDISMRRVNDRYAFAIYFFGFPDDWILDMNAFNVDDNQIVSFS